MKLNKKLVLWILFTLTIAILPLSELSRAQGTHSATYGVTGGAGASTYNCYKSAVSGGPYTKFASIPVTQPANCVDTAPGTVGTKTFYVATAVAGSNESGFSNEVSGVAVGTPPNPQVGAVSEQ